MKRSMKHIFEVIKEWAKGFFIYASCLSIIFTAISYLFSSGERQRNEIYQAWRMVHAGQGKGSSEGLLIAIEDLYNKKSDFVNIDFSGLNLSNLSFSKHPVNLYHSNFSNCIVNFSRFPKANLNYSIFRNADLSLSSLDEAGLYFADFRNADLKFSSFRKAQLVFANFSNAYLQNTDFSYALMHNANFSGADARNANFIGADLRGADFRNLRNWREIDSVKGTIITGIVNSPEGFLQWAKGRGATNFSENKK